MRKYRSLILLALLILAVVAGIALLKKNKISLPFLKTSVDLTAEYEITGILREMDLDVEVKSNRFLADGMYELTRINEKDQKKLPYNATNLFIEKYSEITESMLGKCITVKGKIDAEWVKRVEDVSEGEFKYQEVSFLADEIVKKDFSECDGYKLQVEIPAESTSTVLSGRLTRMARLIPENGPYDYVLVFDQPYTSVENASGEPQLRNYMPAEPKNNEVWEKLEKKLGEPITVEIYELWGFVESKYLLISRVMD